MTERGAILAAITAALSALPSMPTLHATLGQVLASDDELTLLIVPGSQETFLGEVHANVGISGVRSYPVRVVATAWTREASDSLSFEVEDALQYGPTATQIGASFVGATFTESAGAGAAAERVYYSTTVDLLVYYNRASGA